MIASPQAALGRARARTAGRGVLKRASRSEGGFAFTELLVVVIILGILAAIAITVFLQQREKAKASSAISAVRNIMGTAATEFTGTYPDPHTPPGLGLPAAYVLVPGTQPSTEQGEISIQVYDGSVTCGTEPEPVSGCIAMAVRAGSDCFWAWQHGGGESRGRLRGAISDSAPCTAAEARTVAAADRF